MTPVQKNQTRILLVVLMEITKHTKLALVHMVVLH